MPPAHPDPLSTEPAGSNDQLLRIYGTLSCDFAGGRQQRDLYERHARTLRELGVRPDSVPQTWAKAVRA